MVLIAAIQWFYDNGFTSDECSSDSCWLQTIHYRIQPIFSINLGVIIYRIYDNYRILASIKRLESRLRNLSFKTPQSFRGS